MIKTKKIKSFKTYLKDTVREEMIAESSLMDVQVMFDEVDLQIIESTEPIKVENLNKFNFIATTKKGTKINIMMGISELLHPTFIMNLQRMAIV